ncbi:MAG: GHKL domain-containing protein [Spirochaetes bacterium]|nr:GHKL domain-containing protein [Spirochaetota bacterium]
MFRNASGYSLMIRGMFSIMMLTACFLLTLFVAKQKRTELTLRNSEAQIRKMNEQLEVRIQARTKDLEEFAYIVSHDLKAPLRGIGQLTDWLAQDYKKNLDPQGRQILEQLKGRAIHMDRLINSILHYSRIGRVNEKPTLVDLDTIVHDVIKSLPVHEGVTITVEKKLPFVQGSGIRLSEVFQNLIENAIKHRDNQCSEIRVFYEDEPDQWRFSVSDNGPGIDPKYHEKIFMVFETIESTESGSTGIGLAIVKKSIEMYGGKVGVNSQKGKGCTFWFTLPKGKTDEDKKTDSSR